MSYTPTQWQTGDTITAERLNNMENGIEDGQTLVVTITQNGGAYVADKTFSEITSAWSAGKTVIADASAVGTFGILHIASVGTSYVAFSSARGNDIYSITVSSNGSITLSPKYNLYSKPSSGIPQTDLAQAVQNKLDLLIVTLTPTAADFSGTMDKTVGEINAAYEAGRKIRFHLIVGVNEFYDLDVIRVYTDSSGYKYFHAELVHVGGNLLIDGYTGGSDPTSTTYWTSVYSLTPMS